MQNYRLLFASSFGGEVPIVLIVKLSTVLHCKIPASSLRWSRVGRIGIVLLWRKNRTMTVREKFEIQAPGMLLVILWARAQHRTLNTRQRTRRSSPPYRYRSSELFIATLWTHRMTVRTTVVSLNDTLNPVCAFKWIFLKITFYHHS